MKMIIYMLLCVVFNCGVFWAKAQVAGSTDDQKMEAYIEKFKKEDVEAAGAYADLKDRRIRMQEDLDEALNSDSVSGEEKKNLSNQLKTLKKQEKIAFDKLKYANKRLSDASEWIQFSAQKRHKKLLELEREEAVSAAGPSGLKTENAASITVVPNDLTDSLNKPAAVVSADKLASSDDAPKPAPAVKNKGGKSKGKKEKSNLPAPDKEAPSIEPASAQTYPENVPFKETDRLETFPAAPQGKKARMKSGIQKQDDPAAAPPSLVLKKYSAGEDVALNPPMESCKTDFEGRDQLTGKKRKDFSPHLLFSHTEDFMKPQFKDKDYMTCEAQGVWIEGGNRFLNLFFTIQSKEAPHSFGFLERGAAISFILVNGKVARFNAAKTDVGTVDANLNQTVYRAALVAPPSEFKLLTESEVDQVKVVWSTGFENYEVYDTDLMMNIVKCMEK